MKLIYFNIFFLLFFKIDFGEHIIKSTLDHNVSLNKYASLAIFGGFNDHM
jgi:hypothetical protein